LFTDKTLNKFLDDCGDDFFAFINKPENYKFVECFTSHKRATKWTKEEFELFSESVNEIPNLTTRQITKINKWIDYSAETTGFLNVTKKGRTFENLMLKAVKNKNSVEYKRLASSIRDLDQRKLLSQVHFCLPGFDPPCTAKGEYFIADQVWVKYDARGRIQDMIVVDAKLSEGTNLTGGQTKAKNHVGSDNGLFYKQKEIIKKDVLNSKLPFDIEQGQEIKITGFYKIYGDGKDVFKNVKKIK